ncbi:MAG: peptidylprolyl isomerase, partial [Verrucomicrobia bacterium]|nr:peptidylprolyl isomerase [Verrucomicrobiota bacterium]
LNQFPPPDEWKERIKLQGLDERALRGRINDEVKHLDAIESWLAQQPGKITEADARSWYAAHMKNSTIPERIRASHIFLTRHDQKQPDRRLEINELHRKITAGEATFDELVMKYSDDDSAKLRGGDLGWFTRDRVPPEFAEKVFALPVDEMSAPFESHLGWHILIVKEKRPARAATFDEMKDEIAAMQDREWRETAVKRLLEDLRLKAKIVKFDDRIATISPE